MQYKQRGHHRESRDGWPGDSGGEEAEEEVVVVVDKSQVVVEDGKRWKREGRVGRLEVRGAWAWQCLAADRCVSGRRRFSLHSHWLAGTAGRGCSVAAESL